jgi:hypothetical protein
MEYETFGTLNLEIARIERQLELFREQLLMSTPYPDHTKKLKEGVIQLQATLQTLIRRQYELGLDNPKEAKC